MFLNHRFGEFLYCALFEPWKQAQSSRVFSVCVKTFMYLNSMDSSRAIAAEVSISADIFLMCPVLVTT